MKIDRTSSARPAASAKRSGKAAKAEGGEFSQHMQSGPESAAPAGATAPVGSVEGLLALQEAGDSTSGRSKARARKWGHDVLDGLERLRLGIIEGTVPRGELERIAASVARQRQRTDDPALELILDEIELRAKVELAKLDRR